MWRRNQAGAALAVPNRAGAHPRPDHRDPAGYAVADVPQQDPVTGLLNRSAFVSQLLRIAWGGHRWSGHHLAVVVVDPQGFRAVNDAAGDDVGDRVLAEMGRRLGVAAGPDSILARIGGDEFAVAVPVPDPPAADRTAYRLVESFAEPFRIGHAQLTMRACAGVATTHGSGWDVLVRDAGLALQAAKAEARTAGRAGWQRYRPGDHAAVLDRLGMRAELEHAVCRDELALAYQPIVHVPTGRVVGLEALVRWRHPTRGVVPPDRFIGIAEDAGLIGAIGERVLDLAVADAARWLRELAEPVTVSVNVSARQLADPGFGERLLRRLAAAEVPANRLVVEITESHRLADGDAGWDQLGRLRGHGVRIAIDDFGTGYSSLAYLWHAPIDVIKLDRTFVQAVAACQRQRGLVTGVVRLAEALDLQVVAEGIEDRDQYAAVRAAGCQFGQGYLFARPTDAAHMTRWLHSHLTRVHDHL